MFFISDITVYMSGYIIACLILYSLTNVKCFASLTKVMKVFCLEMTDHLFLLNHRRVAWTVSILFVCLLVDHQCAFVEELLSEDTNSLQKVEQNWIYLNIVSCVSIALVTCFTGVLCVHLLFCLLFVFLNWTSENVSKCILSLSQRVDFQGEPNIRF